MVFIVGLIIIAIAAFAILKGFDLRIVLLLAALALGVIAGIGDFLQLITSPTARFSLSIGASVFGTPCMRIIRTFLVTFSNEDFVIPICLAMAFAYVLRETHCDEHLIRLLISPLRHAGSSFIPGVILVGFIVNIPLVSQAATAAAVGTVLIPLGRALRLSPVILGAALVLGSSIGGELLNPGSPELHSVVEALRPSMPTVTTADCVAQVRRLVGWHLLAATAIFWILNRPKIIDTADRSAQGGLRVNLLKAIVPFVPLLLLMLLAPPLQIWHVPPRWLLVDPSNATEAKTYDSRLIGMAMLIGVGVAAMTAPKAIQSVGKAFFDGAGFAFVFIIMMIVGANCFGEGVKLIGLAAVLGKAVQSFPGLLRPLAVAIPMIFGVVSGSGMAATQSLSQLFVGPSNAIGINPLQTGGARVTWCRCRADDVTCLARYVDGVKVDRGRSFRTISLNRYPSSRRSCHRGNYCEV